jgi:hypothetical protein
VEYNAQAKADRNEAGIQNCQSPFSKKSSSMADSPLFQILFYEDPAHLVPMSEKFAAYKNHFGR